MKIKIQHGEKKVSAPKVKRVYESPFPRPICLERCTMNIPKGYEKDIIKTLKSFSNEELYNQGCPHKLAGRDTISLDVKSRNDKYRMLFYIESETGICKITNLCTEETHNN